MAGMLTRELRRRNRDLLHSVDVWLDEATWRAARHGYGCPEHVFPHLDRPVSLEPTYTDVLVALAAILPAPVRYLEIGVSAGKNLYVLARALEGASLDGLDWEAINPFLVRALERAGARAAPAPGPGTRRFTLGRTTVTYVEGDELDPATWTRLGARPYNLVFSDGMHTAEAHALEVERLTSLGLLDPAGFVMLWDDLIEGDPELDRLAGTLAAARPGTRAFHARVNGWLGEHEHTHVIGIASDLGIDHDRIFGLGSALRRRLRRRAGALVPAPVKSLLRRVLRRGRS